MSDVQVLTRPLALGALIALSAACAPVAPPQGAAPSAVPTAGTTVAGWYQQDARNATLQPCAATERLVVLDGAELRRRATAFGLQDGDPVYVRLHGTRTASEFRVSRIEQLGSPQPVRDCPMTGTRIQQ